MKMIIRKSSKSYEVTCDMICQGYVFNKTNNDYHYYFRFDSEEMSDIIEIHFSDLEQNSIFNYLLQNKKK